MHADVGSADGSADLKMQELQLQDLQHAGSADLLQILHLQSQQELRNESRSKSSVQILLVPGAVPGERKRR